MDTQNILYSVQQAKEILSKQQDDNINLLLQGSCKIERMRSLKIDWLKTILLIVPICASIIGLLMIKSYKWFRVMIFYQDAPIQSANYLYIVGTDGIEAIVDIEQPLNQQKFETFFFQKLKYEIKGQKAQPIGFNYKYQNNKQLYFNESYYAIGLQGKTINNHRQKYGLNEHTVQAPYYHEYMLDILTQPYFLIQYLVVVLLILQKLTLFGIMLLAGTVITSSINYILLYLSYKKVKEIAQKNYQVSVLSEGETRIMNIKQLLPGDLFVPQNEIPCDCILVRGQVYVNEVNLTGQNIPIAKFAIDSSLNFNRTNRWMYEGSKVLEIRGNALAMAIYTGYSSERGRIIRKILNRVTKDPDFFTRGIYFMIQTFFVCFIVYLALLPFAFSINIPQAYHGFRFMDLINSTLCPPMAIFFNLVYSFSLFRLRWKNISSTEPQKTVEGSKIRTMCFDKTGTLTENEVQIHLILKYLNDNNYKNIINQKQIQENILITKLFASCHCVRKLNQQFIGDQIDLKMFLYSGYDYNVPNNTNIIFTVSNKNLFKIDVLRVNQFQSKFQSMSVLIKDQNDQFYVMVKGAPQIIQRNSINKFKEFDKILSNLSFQGYRIIGFGYKKLNVNEVEKYMFGERHIFNQKIISLGIVAFENKLKQSTHQTILRLKQSNIQSKIITGDNIYIAIQTGIRAGILQTDQKIILFQGSNQQQQSNQKRVFVGTLVWKIDNQIKTEAISLSEDIDYQTCKYSIAVDNDFINLKPQAQLVSNIKLFTRISAENKALIVRKFKQKYQRQYNSRSIWSRIFGKSKHRVGMVGDGANDLIAIKQADVGMGMNE